MKGRIDRPLREAFSLREPAADRGMTADEYVARLSAVAGTGRAARVAVATFRRWIDSRQSIGDPLVVNEDLLCLFAYDMEAGVFKPLRKRRTYRSSVRQVPMRIALLHNTLVGSDPRILRRLVDMRSLERYRFFLSLTPPTQEAMMWFDEEGLRARRSRMGGLPLTVATRRAAVTEALTLLRRLRLPGLEQITEADVLSLVPKTGPEDPSYQRIVHMLNAVKALFRACQERGILEANPINVIPHNAFTVYGTRDFLPPEALARIRDIETAAKELRNPTQLSDRLILLLLADTALRRSELCSLERDQLRKNRGGYEIDLRPQNQKGADKPTVVLPILYPETNKLLDDYLRWRDSVAGATATRLILDQRKRNASAGAIAEAVGREGVRLNLRTFYKKRAPSPHDLRRTFAMCNAAPLGLNMQAHELADRLRDDIRVVFTHYCRNNPLIAGERAQVYRGRLNGKCFAEEALAMVEKLAALGIHPDMITALRKEIRRATTTTLTAEANREWISEEDAVSMIRSEWGRVPVQRKLRDHLRDRGALCRNRRHGRLQYDAVIVRALLDGYVLLSSLSSITGATSRTLSMDPDVIRIGRDRLVPKKTALSLFVDRRIAAVEKNRPDSGTSITGNRIEHNWQHERRIKGAA